MRDWKWSTKNSGLANAKKKQITCLVNAVNFKHEEEIRGSSQKFLASIYHFNSTISQNRTKPRQTEKQICNTIIYIFYNLYISKTYVLYEL